MNRKEIGMIGGGAAIAALLAVNAFMMMDRGEASRSAPTETEIAEIDAAPASTDQTSTEVGEGDVFTFEPIGDVIPSMNDVAAEAAAEPDVMEVPEPIMGEREDDPIIRAIKESPRLSALLTDARQLTEEEMDIGYVPQAQPGDVIPGITEPEANPDMWIVGDDESEGVGDLTPEKFFSLRGPAMVSDTGELSVSGESLKISGILMPWEGAVCAAPDGEPYDCHAWAIAGLQEHVNGEELFCSVTQIGEQNYGLCDMILDDEGNAADLASWMVSSGLAITNDEPAPSLYKEQENIARRDQNGLWSGEFAFGEVVHDGSAPEATAEEGNAPTSELVGIRPKPRPEKG